MSFIPFAVSAAKAIKRYEVTSLSTFRAGAFRHFTQPVDMKLDQYGHLLVPAAEDFDLTAGTFIMLGVGGGSEPVGLSGQTFLGMPTIERKSFANFRPERFPVERQQESAKVEISSVSLLDESQLLEVCVAVISEVNDMIQSVREDITRTLEAMKGLEYEHHKSS